MKPFLFSLTLSAGLALGSVVGAQEVEERIQSGVLSFSGGNSFTNAVLMITGPNEYEREETASRGLPVFRAKNSGRLVDGFYQYTLTAATDEKVEIKNPVDNGRGELARNYTLKPFAKSGAFVVKDGTIEVARDSAGYDNDAGEKPPE